jgi:hypothetical protein
MTNMKHNTERKMLTICIHDDRLLAFTYLNQINLYRKAGFDSGCEKTVIGRVLY